MRMLGRRTSKILIHKNQQHLKASRDKAQAIRHLNKIELPSKSQVFCKSHRVRLTTGSFLMNFVAAAAVLHLHGDITEGRNPEAG